MPGMNGTGPTGRGPMTGWGRGVCGSGNRDADGRSRAHSRQIVGLGRGRGYRRGYTRSGAPGGGRGFPAWKEVYDRPAYSREDELVSLKTDAAALKANLAAIEKQIRALEGEQETE